VSGECRDHEASGAFVFIGLDPNTSFLDGVSSWNDRGFIVSDEQFRTNLAWRVRRWRVRHGSTKQLPPAVW